MTTVVIVLLGLGLLVWLGVHVGTRLDAGAQRRARIRLAEQNRLFGQLRRAGFVVRRCDPDGLCVNCPFR